MDVSGPRRNIWCRRTSKCQDIVPVISPMGISALWLFAYVNIIISFTDMWEINVCVEYVTVAMSIISVPFGSKILQVYIASDWLTQSLSKCFPWKIQGKQLERLWVSQSHELNKHYLPNKAQNTVWQENDYALYKRQFTISNFTKVT